MQFFTALFSALALAVSTNATPVHVAKRTELIVVSPSITSPSLGDTWPVGSAQNVTWDTTEIPQIAKNYTGTLMLGYYDSDSQSEHLNYTHPLAHGFLLTAGSQNVTVPDVLPRDTYIVVLLGDSGNSSPQFSIV